MFVKMMKLLKILKLEDDLIFFKNEDNLNIFKKWKMTSTFLKRKKTSIYSKWKTTPKPKLILGLAKLSKIYMILYPTYGVIRCQGFLIS